MKEIPVQTVPVDVVSGNDENDNKGGDKDNNPEEDDAVVTSVPPSTWCQRPLGVQLLL